MWKPVWCGLVTGLLVSVSMAAAPPRPWGGRVIDEARRPVAGAKVTAYEQRETADGATEDRVVASAVTGADGRFALATRADTWALTLVAVKDGKALDWSDPSFDRPAEPVLQLGPAGAMEGEVVDDAGKAVAGASVAALLTLEAPWPRKMMAPLPGGALTVRTDAQGRFRFDTVPAAARVNFDLSAPGRARAFAEGRFAPGKPGLRFVLAPEGRIEGTLVEQGTDKPLPNVLLLAYGSVTSGMHHAVAKTDKDGRFTMTGLTGGNYGLSVVGAAETSPGWIASVEKVAVATGTTAAVKVEAVRGGLLELALTDAATKKPLADPAAVSVAAKKDRRITQFGRSGKDGVARFLLLPGEYVVEMIMGPGCAYRDQDGPSFRVEAGRTTHADFPLAVAPRGQVSGIVRDAAGLPVVGAQVRLVSPGGPPTDTVSGEGGGFAIPARGALLLLSCVVARHPRENLAAFAILEKAEEPVEITLGPAPEAVGAVLDAQGRPIAGAEVRAEVEFPHLARFPAGSWTRTAKDGKYQLDLMGGLANMIVARAPGCSPAQMSVEEETRFAKVRGTVKVKDLVLKAADRKVSGIVRDSAGRPVPGAIITATRGEGLDYPDAAVSDAQGAFTLEHLDNAESIYLSAHVPGRGWIGQAFIKIGEPFATITAKPSWYD